MSTYSDAWHALSPRTLAFYHNFHRVRMNQTWHHHYDYEFSIWWWFQMIGWGFLGYFPYAVAYRNWGIQVLDTGSFNPEIVLWSLFENFSPPHPTPRYSIIGSGNYHHEQKDIPFWSYNYPRDKYKVRKSYWTGKPRHRRNL